MADNLWTSPTKRVTLSHECHLKEEQNIRSPVFGKNNKWKAVPVGTDDRPGGVW